MPSSTAMQYGGRKTKLQNSANKFNQRRLKQMSPPSRKQLKRGAAGFGDYPENYDFLQVDNERGNWVAGASGVGYQGERFDDDYGYRRGQGAYTDENEDGLKLWNVLPS